MIKPFHKSLASIFPLSLALAVSPWLTANEIDEPMVMTVGTVHNDTPSGDTWTYLTWEETLDGALDEGPVAVFRKSGEAEAPAPFDRVAVVSWLSDPLTIQSMLNRAPELNDDLARLESNIDEIFGEMLAATDDLPSDGDPAEVSLAHKVAALLNAAAADAEQRETVRWLARVHPVLNLCLGRAFAEVVADSGPVTYEVRHWDPAEGQSLEVIGRITLDPGAGIVRLPAAGYAVEVPPDGPRGHLSVRLRWATPDDLRVRAPLHFGYNVYRMTEDYARDVGYDERPPHPDALSDYAGDPTFTEVVRANRAPVVTDRILSENEALDLSIQPGDQEPFFFFGDDNDRFNHGVPFEDGDGFYYFITARDILGRDGYASDGTHVVVCSQMPPNPPGRVWVENHYRYEDGDPQGQQHLAVHWEPSSSDTAEQYYVYRFTSVNEMQIATQQDHRTEDFRIAGPIEAKGDGVMTYIDDGSGNDWLRYPAGPADYGVPYLYTVRAEEMSACGGNLSGHGAPAWGVLRQREGPEAVDATLIPNSRAITIQPPQSIVDVAADMEVFESRVFQVAVQRLNPAIEWAEIQIVAPMRAPYPHRNLGRQVFGGDDEVSANFIMWEWHLNQPPTILVTAGGSGLTPAQSYVYLPDLNAKPDTGTGGNIGRMVFIADVETGPGLDGVDPNLHVSTDPVTGEIFCLDLEVIIEAGSPAAEWRIYRRIGQGDLELVHQEMREPGADGTLDWQDCALPARGGIACYFVQALDDEGNPGPMTRAGCVQLEPTHSLPTPMLYPVRSLGTEDDSLATVSWFSSPEGVDRFEILIAAEGGTPPEHISDELSARRNDTPITLPGFEDQNFHVYETARVGVGLHGDGPEFSVQASFLSGTDHTILIRAVGQGPFTGRPANDGRPAIAERQRGALSNSETFQWTAPEDEPGPLVPWPARSLPPLADNGARLIADMVTPQTGAGVRIGEFRFVTFEENPQPVSMPGTHPYPLPFEYDPNDAVFSVNGLESVSDDADTDKSLLPAVLYRYQVPNSVFPDVGGNLVQVSPLIREIAFQVRPDDAKERSDFEHAYAAFPPGGHKDYNILQDPFLAAKMKEGANALMRKTHDLFILDNQPVVFGAKYRYLLVRFNDDGEIDRVFPVPALDLGGQGGNGL